MQEICQSGSEGGAKTKFVPTPIPNHWSLYALDVGPDYAAALAVYGCVSRVRHLEWDFERCATEIVSK